MPLKEQMLKYLALMHGMIFSILEELPGQFLSYFRTRDIKPCNFNRAHTTDLPS